MIIFERLVLPIGFSFLKSSGLANWTLEKIVFKRKKKVKTKWNFRYTRKGKKTAIWISVYLRFLCELCTFKVNHFFFTTQYTINNFIRAGFYFFGLKKNRINSPIDTSLCIRMIIDQESKSFFFFETRRKKNRAWHSLDWCAILNETKASSFHLCEL